MHRPLGRCASRYPASLVFGVLLVGVIAFDLRFVALSGRGRAIVRSVTAGGRSGITFAEVERLDGAGPRRADPRAWYTPLRVGERVAIRNRGTGVRAVVLDRNWDLFWRSGARQASPSSSKRPRPRPGDSIATLDRPRRPWHLKP